MTADDLARFIAERLDEHEQGARAAATEGGTSFTPVWTHQSDHVVATEPVTPPPAKPGVRAWRPPQYEVAEADGARGEHIARHDPALILAFVDAGRAIMREHAMHSPDFRYCEQCAEHPLYENASLPWPCPTVRAFALIWRGHPDYRDEWRPE